MLSGWETVESGFNEFTGGLAMTMENDGAGSDVALAAVAKAKRWTGTKRAGVAAGTLAALWGAAVALLWATQGKHVFCAHESKESERTHKGMVHLCEKQMEEAPDGALLERWVLRNTTARQAPVLVWFAGRGEDVSWMLEGADGLENWNVVLAQHRGFGRGTGKPSKGALVEDACRLAQRMALEFPGSKVVIGGRSLGTGVAVEACSRLSGLVKGCVLLTPYASFLELVRMRVPRIFPVGSILRHNFESHALAKGLGVPLLSIVAENDETIPRESSAKLFSAWMGPKEEMVVPGVGHIGIALEKAVWKGVDDFAAVVAGAVGSGGQGRLEAKASEG